MISIAVYLQMLLIQPTDEMSKKIMIGLNENPMTRDKDLENIKQWLAKQPHLPQFHGIDIRFDYLKEYNVQSQNTFHRE